jgi:hypothetical protein
MNALTGMVIYLVLLLVVVAIAFVKRTSPVIVLFVTPIGGVGLALLGSYASGGNSPAAGWMGFSSLAAAFLLVLCAKSRARRIEDGDFVDGYRKCPYCAEQIRTEAVKCRHCGSEVTA